MTRHVSPSVLLSVVVCTLGLSVGPALPALAGMGGHEDAPPFPGYFSLWPSGKVPVVISRRFTESQRYKIVTGLLTWGFHTDHAVRFHEIPAYMRRFYGRYVYIVTPEQYNTLSGDPVLVSGCGSWGPHTEGPTYVWLEKRTCTNDPPSILHEVGHSIGLGHEHLRPDRRFYMEFEAGYVPPPPNPGDPPPPWPDPWGPDPVGFFDYDSIMHQWPVLDHSTPLAPGAWTTGDANTYPHELSDGDIDTVRALYAFDNRLESDIVGGDYATFVADRRECQLACAADIRCKAYTYAGSHELPWDNWFPQCFLKKGQIPGFSGRLGREIHSGVRRAKQKGSFGVILDMDLLGGQLSTGGVVSMPHNLLNGKNCKELCVEDPDCDAFTFVPGEDSGTCYKKTHNPVPPEPPFTFSYQDGYLSGVVRKRVVIPPPLP